MESAIAVQETYKLCSVEVGDQSSRFQFMKNDSTSLSWSSESFCCCCLSEQVFIRAVAFAINISAS